MHIDIQVNLTGKCLLNQAMIKIDWKQNKVTDICKEWRILGCHSDFQWRIQREFARTPPPLPAHHF